MPIRLNSTLREAIATNYGIGAMMQYGCILVLTGSQAASADDALQGTVLGYATQDGLPFTPGQISGGLKVKGGALRGSLQNDGLWVLKVVTSGIAGHWRWVWNRADMGMAGEDVPRIDGAVGESLRLTNTALVAGASHPLEGFNLFIPPQGI